MNVEFLFSEVMKHSERSRVEKWKISTFLLLMQLRNFNVDSQCVNCSCRACICSYAHLLYDDSRVEIGEGIMSLLKRSCTHTSFTYTGGLEDLFFSSALLTSCQLGFSGHGNYRCVCVSVIVLISPSSDMLQ